MRLLIENATVVLADSLARDHAVVCEDGRVVKVCPTGELTDRQADDVVDAAGGTLMPGFIDLHFHGAGRFLIDSGPDDLAGLCRLLGEFGVTGFLPGVCPRPKGEDAEALALLAEVRSEGSAILGFHLEGPFLTLTGALPPQAIGTNDPDRVRALIDAARPHKAIFSIAPDFEGILDLIPIMASGGTPVFMTHTAADVAQTQAAIEAGVRHATHFYDVFPCPDEVDLGVRPCGAVEAVLADPRVSVDFICDGEHVDPVAMKMALLCKGADGVSLITDSNTGAGLPPGRYAYGDEEIEFAYPGSPARFTDKGHIPGALAGSGLTMCMAFVNALKLLGVDVPQASRMASASPARVLGLADRKGQVREGFDADLVLLDEAQNVMRTWVAGRCVFSRTA